MGFIKDDVVKQHASELRTDASELRAAAAEAEAKASKFEAMVEAGLLRRREFRQRMTNTPARLPASKEAGVKASSHKAAGVQVSSHKGGSAGFVAQGGRYLCGCCADGHGRG